jgi:endonuclease-3
MAKATKKNATKKTPAKAKKKSARRKTKSKPTPKPKTKAKTKPKSKGKTPRKAKKPATPSAPPTPQLKRRALALVRGLQQDHPDAHCELDFTNALELLVATILAAQCTDKRVNIVTKDLFKKYRTAQDYLDVPDDELKEEIRSTGFFNNKTKAIKKAARSIVDQFEGEVPATMDELLHLAGVGRKTANVILANVFDVPGIVVDTHMLRLTRRMGLTENTDATKVEQDVMEILPKEEWISWSHLIPWHGRRVCTARNPACDECAVADVCPKLI